MYFQNKGKENTAKTIAFAKTAAIERGIKHIVVASNSGETAILLEGTPVNIVCVSHAYGFLENGKNEMPDEMRQKLSDSGIKVLSAAHVLSGAERGISKKCGGVYPVEIIAYTLRMFGQGTKVCVEVSTMALDSGLIPYGEEIIAIGGSGRGADTALILKPAHANNIFDTEIVEYICKPLKI
jgi:hypothetical protein